MHSTVIEITIIFIIALLSLVIVYKEIFSETLRHKNTIISLCGALLAGAYYLSEYFFKRWCTMHFSIINTKSIISVIYINRNITFWDMKIYIFLSARSRILVNLIFLKRWYTMQNINNSHNISSNSIDRIKIQVYLSEALAHY